MTKEERLHWLRQIEKDIWVCSLDSTFEDDAKSCAIHSVIEELEQEPKTGRWLDWTDDRNDYLKCSMCGYGEEGEVKFGEYTPYCPMCGTKMESDE